jgi:microcystin-dependent protein
MKRVTFATACAAAALTAGTGTPAHAQASDMYLGQLMLVPYNFCPRSWADASGQILSIAQNTALFSLLGTTYGGNGQTTFALPDLRGRVPMGQGQGPGLSPRTLGEVFGTETNTLTISQMPAHTHTGYIVADKDTVANKASPAGNALARAAAADIYTNTLTSLDDPMANGTVMTNPTGGSQPFNNMSPTLVMRWCIALEGIFPSRN